MGVRILLFVAGLTTLLAISECQSASQASAPVSSLLPSSLAPAGGPNKAPAPAAAAKKAPAPPAPPVYAPKRSFGTWVKDLKHDPTLLIAFIISLLSGVGFLFIIYALGAEVAQAVPYMLQSRKFSRGQQPSMANGAQRTAY